MKVRRIILGSLVGSALAASLFIMQGCVIGDDGVLRIDWDPSGGWEKANCDPCQPRECCPCPWRESCTWPNTPPKLPDWCEDWKADGGNLCAEGGADSGMMSFCSSGSCVPSAPEAWQHVAFFMDWMRESPACPDDAPNLVFEGSPAPPERTCLACSCDAPEGTCNLPATWTVSSEVCPGTSGTKTNIDPPSGWDGTCSQESALAQGKLCGGVPCVRSLTISPPVIEEQPCTPRTEGAVDLPVARLWSGADSMPIGKACASNKPLPSCSGAECSGTNSAFGACIMHDGDQVCPAGWTGDRHVLYGSIEDTRECSACGCDAPQGGSCQVKWRSFSGPSCTAENASKVIATGMMPEPCWDFVSGEALAGKTAEIVDYTKGSCAPTGGELVGDVKLENQVTICCHASTM